MRFSSLSTKVGSNAAVGKLPAQVGEHVISVPQQYPDKRLKLEVRHLTGWKGTPRGHEGQALAWVVPDKLMRYAMPPADRPVVAALLHPAGPAPLGAARTRKCGDPAP